MKNSITHTCITAYARFFEKHLFLVLLFAICTTLLSLYGISRLTFNDDIIKLFVQRGPARPVVAEDIKRRAEHGLLIMLEGEELFNSESLRVLWESSEGLKEIDGVVEVASLYDLRTPRKIGRRRTFSRVLPPPEADIERMQKAKQIVQSHPMAKGQVIANDGKAMLMGLEIDSHLTTTTQLKKLTDDVTNLLKKTTQGTQVKATVTGVPAIRVEVSEATVRDQLVFNIIGPIVAIIIALIMFRRLASVFIVVSGAIMGVVWTFGMLGIIGEPLNPINAVVAPLALTIGLTDSVHMLIHIRKDLMKGLSKTEAAIHSIPTVGFPSAMTSLTSAVGFISLGIAELDVLAWFGIGSAIAVLVAFASVMTIVPLLSISFLGNFITHSQPTEPELQEVPIRWHTRIAIFVVDRKWPVLILSLLLTALALYLGCQVQTDPRIARGLPQKGETLRAFQKVESEFGGSLPLVTTVHWSEDESPTAEQVFSAIQAAHQALESQEILGPPTSVMNLYQSMQKKDQTPNSLFLQISKIPEDQRKVFFDRERRRSLVVARCQDAGGYRIDHMLTNLENQFEQLEQQHPGFRFRITDTILQGLRACIMIVGDLLKSLMMAVPLTLAVIMLELKSIKCGIIALLPNIFPMAALAATMVVLGQSISLTGVAVFVMCFGIAVDDTIHTITAFTRHFDAGESVRDSIIQAYRELGDAVISTTIILVGGLGVVMLSQTYTIQQFGFMFCIGLAWAVVGDLLILPAALACFPHRRRSTATQQVASEDA